MKKGKQIVVQACALLTLTLCSFAATHTANTPFELTNISRSVKPGDTIILPDGTYTNQHFIFNGKGTKEEPITLRGETAGKVILNGTSKLSIGGDYLVVDGLLFRGGALESGSVIEFRAKNSQTARHCILRNTAIIDYNPTSIDTRYHWVSLYGMENRVEDCLFSGQSHSGVTLCVVLDGAEPASHVIRRNHFANRPKGNGNGFETIRIGTGKSRMANARCVVSNNLFEQCHGEIEIISNKSCENIYTQNTFLNSSGCLTLRQGKRCKVEANVFIGGDTQGAGGVRVIGESHQISNNYFSGTKGRAGGTISLQAGIPYTIEDNYSLYPQVKDCVIKDNVFVDNPGALFALDASYGKRDCVLLPMGVVISNNLLVAAEDASPMIETTNEPTGIAWKDNVAVGGELGIGKLRGIQCTDSLSPALNARLAFQSLKPSDVGPKWMHRHASARAPLNAED